MYEFAQALWQNSRVDNGLVSQLFIHKTLENFIYMYFHKNMLNIDTQVTFDIISLFETYQKTLFRNDIQPSLLWNASEDWIIKYYGRKYYLNR